MILASGSPRRKELLETLGVEFEIKVSNIEEVLNDVLPLHEQVMDLAKQKADALDIENELILSADTIVVIDDEILGKPTDEEDAYRMLKRLSNQVHYVYTGCCLKKGNQYSLFYDCTKIHFKKLTKRTILEYIKTKEPMDKAGAYGIQGIGGKLIDFYIGDFHNVMGLPVYKLKEELEKIKEDL